jgi:hypothetical protein
LHQYVQQTVANRNTNDATVEVSDDSCDVESEGSFGSLGLSFFRRDSSNDEDSTVAEESDGRWNIPFDDTNEDDLVPKSLVGETLPRVAALSDVGFKSIADGGDASSLADGLASMHVTSPLKPIAVRGGPMPFRAELSPIIVQAERRGLSRVDSNGCEKENVDPIRKRLSADKCTLGVGRPCR